MSNIIPFPCSTLEREILPEAQVSEPSKQKLKQCLHDIRSPLSIFELVREGRWPNSPIFSQAYARLEHIIGEIESVINSDANPKDRDHANNVTFPQVIDDILQEKNALKTHQDGHLTCKIDNNGLAPALPSIVDTQELKRIIANLIDNALEAGPEKIPELSYRFHKNNHCFQVKDFGRGMNSHFLENLSASSISSKGAHRGLGLTHARNTLYRWGGSLKVSSAWGTGCTIALKLSAEGLKIL